MAPGQESCDQIFREGRDQASSTRSCAAAPVGAFPTTRGLCGPGGFSGVTLASQSVSAPGGGQHTCEACPAVLGHRGTAAPQVPAKEATVRLTQREESPSSSGRLALFPSDNISAPELASVGPRCAAAAPAPRWRPHPDSGDISDPLGPSLPTEGVSELSQKPPPGSTWTGRLHQGEAR